SEQHIRSLSAAQTGEIYMPNLNEIVPGGLGNAIVNATAQVLETIFQIPRPGGGTVMGAPLMTVGPQTVPVQGEVTELVVPTADVLRPPVPVIGELKELDATQAQNWSVS